MIPPEPPPAALRLRVDEMALAANWRALDRLSGRASAGAAVKADAYGVGARRAVPVLAAAGCRDFFVAHWSEVAALLDLVPPGSISVLHGPLSAADVAYCRATGVKPVLNSLAQIARWQAGGGGLCDLMIDSGIDRLGLAISELADVAAAGLAIDICMSHLASADEDVAQNGRQLVCFQAIRDAIPARRYSLANSAGIALGADYHFDLTRPGLALYGGVPRSELAGVIAQVAFPQAAVLQVRLLQPGDAVGYNATFVAERAMRVGVIALGYADGYLRCWSGKGRFRWGDAELAVLGRVSMDMTVIDLSDAPDCGEGDWIEALYDLPAASATSGLSQYELLTLLGMRFAR
ncbi:alanine racemase [Novosphingobium sp. Gsoil 351]|uniref:alanine racemase n=1 Tax=Novosphingobium sp. Gsoil 351 TaxID=2675225 RepID=UPI0012B4B612|nr:alanine racemase [Novosphingobium sp. Gsoil 351]QGN53323.1 alanine racemase [Novosphingobium sp. Gsoil 351]